MVLVIFCSCFIAALVGRSSHFPPLVLTTAPRFTLPWQPVLSAVTRRARHLEVPHLPLLLRALQHGGVSAKEEQRDRDGIGNRDAQRRRDDRGGGTPDDGVCDDHLIDALAARLLEALPLKRTHGAVPAASSVDPGQTQNRNSGMSLQVGLLSGC